MKIEKNKKPAPGHVDQRQQSKKQVKRAGYYPALGIGIVCLLGIIIYSNSLNGSFHLDDFLHIVNNPNIRNLSDLGKIWKNNPDLPGFAFMPYRPVSIFTFALNYHFGQLDVWGYHLFNLLLHLINACLTGWLVLLIFSSPSTIGLPISNYKKVLALLAALLFVSHPLATQSVNYIVQRMNLLATLFYLVSVSVYLYARISDKSSTTRYLLFAGSFVSALLAILSKENAVTIPLAMALIELCFLRTKPISINFKDYRVILAAIVVLFGGVIMFFVLSKSILKPLPASTLTNTIAITPINYFVTQFGVIVKYIQLLFLPLNQNLDYDLYPSTNFFEPGTVLSLLLLMSLGVIAVLIFNKHRILSFGIFWFFLTLAVESSIIPIEDMIFEHRTYLPSVGFFLILVYCAHTLLWNKGKYAAIAVLSIIICINAILTFERNKVWENELTLWSDVVSKSPEKARALNNLGVAYLSVKKNELAIQNFDAAIRSRPKYAEAYNNRGDAFKELGKNEEAIKDFEMAINLKPKYVEAYGNCGNSYAAMGNYTEAIKKYDIALAIRPDYKDAYSNRGNAYMSMKIYDQAIKDFNQAIRIDLDFARPYYNRSIAYFSIQKFRLALEDENKAKQLGYDVDPRLISVTEANIAASGEK